MMSTMGDVVQLTHLGIVLTICQTWSAIQSRDIAQRVFYIHVQSYSNFAPSYTSRA